MRSRACWLWKWAIDVCHLWTYADKELMICPDSFIVPTAIWRPHLQALIPLHFCRHSSLRLQYWSALHPYSHFRHELFKILLSQTYLPIYLCVITRMRSFNREDGESLGWNDSFLWCSGECAHLLHDTDGDDRAAGVPRGHCARSSPATWQCLPSCFEEMSLLICVSEVTTLQGRATTRTNNTLHSTLDICYNHFLCKK